MVDALIYTDVRIAKQRRSHAVVIDDAKDHLWFNSIIDALHYCWDAGFREITLSDDGGSCVFHIRSWGDPVS